MKSMDQNKFVARERRRGRGSRSNVTGRYEQHQYEDFDDGWSGLEDLPAFKTRIHKENAKTILTTNKSPDIPFSQSINPYRGCEHGCPYCYARPAHAYLGHSPGLDFETKLYVKVNTREKLISELSNPNYKPKTIALGANTDPYQPIEREYKMTRSVLEICLETKHPVTIVTKSALVCRDKDLLEQLASHNLVRVALSITSLDHRIARSMEPRASTPSKRVEAVKILSDHGVPTMVMMAPVIPSLNDAEMETILKTSSESGARSAAYVLLRLPLELKEIFDEWLDTDFPNRKEHIFSLIKSMRQGKLYDASWGTRMRGEGVYADLIEKRFRLAKKRYGLDKDFQALSCDQFQPPKTPGQQLQLL